MSGETEQQVSGWTVDTLKESIDVRFSAQRDLMDERDRLYKERDEARRTAVDAALKASDEKTISAFAASEKAIVKAEESQKDYNASHNDLLRKMDEQHKDTLPRAEADAKFDFIGKEVQNLRESRSEGVGSRVTIRDLVTYGVLFVTLLAYLRTVHVI